MEGSGSTGETKRHPQELGRTFSPGGSFQRKPGLSLSFRVYTQNHRITSCPQRASTNVCPEHWIRSQNQHEMPRGVATRDKTSFYGCDPLA